MRIGVDVLAIQSPYSAGRGIGRYSRHFLDALLALDRSNEYVLYAYDDLPRDQVPTSDRTTFRTCSRDPSRHEHNYQHLADRVARENRDRLDWLLVLSPFETWRFYGLPAKPLNGLRCAAILYDLIPWLFQDVYLQRPEVNAWFQGHLTRLRSFDRLLAISQATRSDALDLLRLPPRRVATIGTASDPDYFTPAPPGSKRPTILDRIGVTSPFVFCLGSGDPRKNLDGLFRAFKLMSPEIRNRHELVVACKLDEEEAARTIAQAERHGVADQLRLAGEVVDEDLRDLYRTCAAFAFPSTYEGFGLPILEAMHCGASVLAGDNSSQPEVVGDAGLLADANDPADLARGLERLLADRPFAESLGKRAIEQAALFRWDAVARRALESIESATRDEPRSIPKRPHLACFSPWPPRRSGVADYADRLARSLHGRYRLDLYREPGLVGDDELAPPPHASRDYRVFPRRDRLGLYAGRLLYHVGNSHYHHFQLPMMLERPGVVVLHDYGLAGFHLGLDAKHAGHLRQTFAQSQPNRWDEFVANRAAWEREPGGLQEAMARRRIDLNAEILRAARAIIVHSQWCRDRIAADHPGLIDRVSLIPMGAEARPVSPERREAARSRFGYRDGDVVVASVGILHPTKLSVPTIEAFDLVARHDPSVHLLFAGRDLGGGEAARAVERLGLSDRVRFLGHCESDDYLSAIEAADVGVCLREPPTKGESSASLVDLLRHGRATIVCDTGTFAEWPDVAVDKVDWPDERAGINNLAETLAVMASDHRLRRGFEEAAIGATCAWSVVAERYAAVLDAA